MDIPRSKVDYNGILEDLDSVKDILHGYKEKNTWNNIRSDILRVQSRTPEITRNIELAMGSEDYSEEEKESYMKYYTNYLRSEEDLAKHAQSTVKRIRKHGKLPEKKKVVRKKKK